MFKTRYLIRLDDACPTMSREWWGKVEAVLDKYGVRPLVGIVPNCKDEKLELDTKDEHFWEKARGWQEKGWAIAMHGYDHEYLSDKGLEGLNPLWKRSEYAGVSLDVQRKKIREGVAILKHKGLDVKYFFAPSHTFDTNTLIALREESEIRVISDMYTLKPYREGVFVFIPCQIGHPQKMPLPGTFTICLHPNTFDNAALERLDQFLKENRNNMISFSDIDLEKVGRKRLIDRLVSWAYYKRRSMRIKE